MVTNTIIGIAVALLAVIFIVGLSWKIIFLILNWRTVVPTNEVHITQGKKGTIAYGRDLDAGNVYILWPSWIPKIGIQTITLPTSIFDIELRAYDAYDQGRLPFTVDVKAFFKIDKAEDAAQRVENFDELKSQLQDILKGSVRSILAGSDIETILSDRSKFGDDFTKEVAEQLTSWGVNTVKNIEFMDLRDSDGSHVIENIMAKKKSLIEMESRREVAENKKNAQMSEIDAKREAAIRQQDADREVGEKEAEKKRKIGIANETAEQEIKEEAKVTAEKEMAVHKVEEEKRAEIDRNVAKITADKERDVQVIKAEADAASALKEKDEKKYQAEAELIKEQNRATGIKLVGEAEAEALKLKELAPIQAQIELAKEIGENQGYQNYLLGLEQVQASIKIEIEKAKALAVSDIKIITTSSTVGSGMTSIMDVFSADGGSKLGSVFEGFKNTPMGETLLRKVGLTEDDSAGSPTETINPEQDV